MLIVDLFNEMPLWGRCVSTVSFAITATILVHKGMVRVYGAAKAWLSESPDAERIREFLPRLFVFLSIIVIVWLVVAGRAWFCNR